MSRSAAFEKENFSAEELLREAPKTLTCDYLRQLFKALSREKLKSCSDVDAVSSSLLLMVLDESTAVLEKCLAIAVLQKLPPIPSVAEILDTVPITQLISAIPVIFNEGTDFEDIKILTKRLGWSLQKDSLSSEEQKTVLAFLNSMVHLNKNPLNQETVKRISNLLPSWLITTIPMKKSEKISRFQRSSSTLSITEIDGTEINDIFTVLNFAHVTTPEQLLSIQVFSMLRSWLLKASRSSDGSGHASSSELSAAVSEDLSTAVQEYCLRLIDQTKIKPPSPGIAEYQRVCLVEAISLLDVICCADPGIIHEILRTMKIIYKEVSESILECPESKDVAVVAAVMQFFMHHSSAVTYKHDDLYPFFFCELLNACYEDSFAAFEIIYVMKENLPQLCYHSSVLEKYFPTFFKVLARWPTTFVDDFVQLLPSFMSQQTSMEVFHTLLDLPCLSAVLVAKGQSYIIDEDSSLETPVSEMMKRPAYRPILNFTLRKCSSLSSGGERETFGEFLKSWYKVLSPLASHPTVAACADACIILLKCFFSTFSQYGDAPVVVLLVPAMLEKLPLIFSVPGYAHKVQKIFADGFVQLFSRYPVVVFHCQKIIAEFLAHLKNYSFAEDCFIHLMWAVGEYVSVEYSGLCRPEIIICFYQSIEPTVYEIISSLSWSSDDLFLKLLNISLSTLAKLAARSQDLVPRAVLILSKAHKQLTSFDECHKKSWRIVIERTLELLNILKTPNVASVILSPPKDLETGKLHRDATSLPFVLRAVTALLSTDSQKSYPELEHPGSSF